MKTLKIKFNENDKIFTIPNVKTLSVTRYWIKFTKQEKTTRRGRFDLDKIKWFRVIL